MTNFLKFVFLTAIIVFFSSCKEEDRCEIDPQSCFEEQLEKDLTLIQDYVEENNLDAIVHSSGLHLVRTKVGEGDSAINGQILTVDYVGRFLDGTVFDTSIDSVAEAEGVFDETKTYEPLVFKLGARNVIAGWDIAFRYFAEGSEGILLVPSYLAYGTSGRGSIPPNTVLLFEVKLLSIRF